MRQTTLVENSFAKCRKATRKEKFLAEMDRIVLWWYLAETILPYYPDPQGIGRRPKGVEQVLCIYFMQHWFQLLGLALALYDTAILRRFAGFYLWAKKPVPTRLRTASFATCWGSVSWERNCFGPMNAYLDERSLQMSHAA